MSDVREQLIETLKAMDYLLPDQQVADAILARFEVTPKPVVTAEELGQMMARVIAFGRDAPRFDEAGHRMLDQLERAGLTIVRIEPEPTPTGRVG